MDGERDRELVERCIAADGEAWRELVERTVPVVSRMVYRTLRRFGHPAQSADVEEISLGIYARLWEGDRRKLRLFRWDCALETWIVGFARVEAIHHAAVWKRRRDRPLPVEPAEREEAALGGDLERFELKQAVREAMSSLPKSDRQILHWVYEENRSYRRIAGELGVPWTTLADRIHKIKTRLANLLKDHLFCL